MFLSFFGNDIADEIIIFIIIFYALRTRHFRLLILQNHTNTVLSCKFNFN